MKLFLTLVLILSISHNLTATENFRAEAKAWAQEVATLETKEQQSIINFVRLGTECLYKDFACRKSMATLINITNLSCVNVIRSVYYSHEQHLYKEHIQSITNFFEAYKDSCETHRALIESKSEIQFPGNASKKCKTLFEQFDDNIKKNFANLVRSKKNIVTDFISESTTRFFHTSKKINQELYSIYDHLKEQSQSAPEKEEFLYPIEKIMDTAYGVYIASFKGIEAAIHANMPEKIFMIFTKEILEVYLEELHAVCTQEIYDTSKQQSENSVLDTN